MSLRTALLHEREDSQENMVEEFRIEGKGEILSEAFTNKVLCFSADGCRSLNPLYDTLCFSLSPSFLVLATGSLENPNFFHASELWTMHG